MPTVSIPTALRSFADNQDQVRIDGSNVGQLLTQLGTSFPRLRPHLFNDQGELRNFVNVFVNEENIRDLQSQETPVKEGDEVMIVPAVAGGADGGCCGGGSCSSTAAIADVTLNKDEIARYSRHLIIPEVGMDGQKKLKTAKILLIGAGGLGAPLAMYLAAAGVGKLGLVEFDVVDFSNLQRQVIHRTCDVGKTKLESATRAIKDINPFVEVEGYNVPLTSENALDIFRPYDMVIDGTDNFPTRYLVNDACVLLGKPNVYGSIFRFDGQATVFNYEDGPCYRCLYPDPPPPGLVPSCAEGGVLGILPGIVGMIQATEAIKMIIGQGRTLKGRLLLFDALGMKFREMKIRRNPACPVCGDNPTIKELIDYKEFCGVPDEPTEQKPEAQAAMAKQSDFDISPRDFKKLLDENANIVVLDVREPHEYQICNLGGQLIPLGQLQGRLDELDKDADIIVHCRSGGRSAKAGLLMKAAGFKKIRNLQGGILAWSDQVDPSVPKY